MSKLEKFVAMLLSGNSDQHLDFSALCSLLLKLGFSQRIKGSHHIFAKEGIEEIINLQPSSGGNAKAYQAKQVRELLRKYGLELKPTLTLTILPPFQPPAVPLKKPKK